MLGQLRNNAPYICLCFSLRDYLTSSSTNRLLWSNLANFGFAPQSQFLIYIYSYRNTVTAIKKQNPYVCLFFSLRYNLTCSFIISLFLLNLEFFLL